MFWSKVHKVEKQIVVAICDKDLINKKLEIDLEEDFFCGQKVDDKKAIELMQNAHIGNLFGKKIIDLAEKKGLIDMKNIIFVGDVPHAQYARQ